MDVTDPAPVKDAIHAAEDHFDGIDVLINNAGYGIVGAVEETPESGLRNLRRPTSSEPSASLKLRCR